MLVTGAGRGLGAAVVSSSRADGLAVVGADLRGADVELDVRGLEGWRRALGELERAGAVGPRQLRGPHRRARPVRDRAGRVGRRARREPARRVSRHPRARAGAARGGGGRIVNVSSDSALKGRGVVGAHYAASKAALLSLTWRAAAALAPAGVTVNAVVPGTIDGETVRELAGDQLDAMAREAASAGSPIPPRSPHSSRGSWATSRPTSRARRSSQTAVQAL